MKNSKSKILLIITGILITGMFSCELEEFNPSGSTADAIWSTPEGFLTVVNAAYSDLRTWYGKYDGIYMSETGTDIWINRQNRFWASELERYRNFTPDRGNPNKAAWGEMHRGLNVCNAGIGRIDDAGFPSEEEKNQRLGELRFLRAFYLWHIVETWGGVQLRTEETTEPLLTAERTPVEDFYAVIISDLEYAAEHLPIDQGDEYSRATKKSALGMLARALLTRAYYSVNEEEANSYFSYARDVADSIILNNSKLGVFLWDDYADVFNPNYNKENKEALFVISNSENTNINYDQKANGLHMYYLTPYHDKPGLNLNMEYGYPEEWKLMPTLRLLDLYDHTIDARYAGSFQEAWLANDITTANYPRWTKAELYDNFANHAVDSSWAIKPQGDTAWAGEMKFQLGDTALLITKTSLTYEKQRGYIAIDRDSIYYANSTRGVYVGDDFPPLTKFMDPLTRTAENSKYGYLDIIVIRLAEMYLIAAEAEYQLENEGKAYNRLVELTNRSSITGNGADLLAAYGVNSGGDIDIEFILEERGRELCGEHLRWFDVKRVFVQDPSAWVAYIKEHNPDITDIQEFHIVRPIPLQEVDALLNSDAIQNPGY